MTQGGGVRPLTVSFIGYGSIAEEHARAFHEIPGVTLESVVGRVPEPTAEFAARHGFKHSTLDLEEALERPGVDAFVITSPSDIHADQAEQCLRAGKAVLVEIPLATNLRDAERVVSAAGGGDSRRLMVAHTQRFYPALVELRRRVAEGELSPHHVVCRWFFLRRDNVNWKGRRRSWTDNLLWHHACHVVDAALWLLGATSGPPAEGVTAQAGPDHPTLGIPLDLDLQFRTGGGVPVAVSMSYNCREPVHDYVVIGEEATLCYEGGALHEGVQVLLDGGGSRAVLAQDREFVEALREERPPSVTGGEVMPALRVLHQAEEAIGRVRSSPHTATGEFR